MGMACESFAFGAGAFPRVITGWGWSIYKGQPEEHMHIEHMRMDAEKLVLDSREEEIRILAACVSWAAA